MEEARWRLAGIESKVTYCADEYSVLNNADAVVLMTEWNQFRGMNLEKMRSRMKGRHFFDLRNVFVKNNEVRKLFDYYPVGQE